MSPRAKPSSCEGCQCYSHGTDFSIIEGTGSIGVLDVGEASGEHEAREQRPFVEWAPAGGVRERTFKRMGLSRQQFSTTNILRCRPRNNWLEKAPWEYSAINHCRPNLEAAIAERRPRCIHALGGVALRELTGMAGEQQGITHLAGYVLPFLHRERNRLSYDVEGFEDKFSISSIPVIGNFHPAYLRRGKASHQGVYARILQRAINIASGKDRSWLWNVDPEDYHGQNPNDLYITHPSLEEGVAFANRVEAEPQRVLSYDIETSESVSLDEDAREGYRDTEIRLVQFSLGAGDAIAFPWEHPYKEVVRRLLVSSNPKCGHNVWLFDNKVLRAAGEREGLDLNPRGTIHDTLQMFHHWQPDLPAHLQFAASFVQFPFPWKHLAASDLEFYGCCDVDATIRLYTMLEASLRRDQVWGDDTIGYIGQVCEVRPVLAGMEDRGVPIDDSARLALGEKFDKAQTELGAELSRLAPKECSRVRPKEGYKGVPPEIKPLLYPLGPPLNNENVPSTRFKEPGDDGECYHYEQRPFSVATVDAASGDPVSTTTLRWCRVYDFNPNSRNQVIEYMKAKGHTVPKSREEDDEGNRKETTQEKELRRLAVKTGDNFYLKVTEYRGFTKLRSTYIEGFEPNPDGCVHTTFTFDTGIGQFGSRNPNVQNFPKLQPTPELATEMRRMIAAKPGRILTEWDFKSCHVITLGFLAEDLNYMRLGRLDIHSFVAGHFLNLWDGAKIFSESDDELLTRFKWLKSDIERKHIRDDQAKHGILGIGNGLKAKGLFERYMENFPARPCPVCNGTGRVPGVRASTTKQCPECKATGMQPGRKIAEQVLHICEQLFPKVFAHQLREAKEAHEKQFLRTPFGHLRRFYEVFRWDAQRHDMVPGDQHEEAVAYRLANIAFGHIREKLKDLHRAGLDEKYGLFNNVHDSFMFHFDERLLEEHVREIYPLLVAPSRVLKHPTICPDGLVIGVEGSWGKNWGEMKGIENPKEAPVATVH